MDGRMEVEFRPAEPADSTAAAAPAPAPEPGPNRGRLASKRDGLSPENKIRKIDALRMERNPDAPKMKPDNKD